MVPTYGEPGLEQAGRRRAEKIVQQELLGPTVTYFTIQSHVELPVVPQTITKRLEKANLQFKHHCHALLQT
ncbi:hypothetical protein TNCT_136621 [Trichonephila clavata]|uniref:Uncharacterized protein n=1 Tax=Trichonephila clavata TaxID=2740835 RepID=A0A8X6LBR2_TRICU|nr:hypothetical protein TNCT_136621 [Trichonephila clavata]